MNKRLNIPLTLREVEIAEDKFREVLDRMSKNAFEDPCTLTNPRSSSSEDVKKIYESVYYGTSALEIQFVIKKCPNNWDTFFHT